MTSDARSSAENAHATAEEWECGMLSAVYPCAKQEGRRMDFHFTPLRYQLLSFTENAHATAEEWECGTLSAVYPCAKQEGRTA